MWKSHIIRSVGSVPEEKIQTFSLKKDGETNITPNFKVKEFRSKCGSDTVIIDVDFIKNKLQKIREHFNKPISITESVTRRLLFINYYLKKL
ncbi:MAG: hypothetical protein FWC41_09000 [Firmicutes bacterium]|nr:hypothetical protein [Bacillota bacterium]